MRVSMQETRLCALQEFEAGAPGAIDEIAAIAEIPDAAHVRVLHVPFEHRFGVGIGQMAFRDDAVRIADLSAKAWSHFVSLTGSGMPSAAWTWIAFGTFEKRISAI